MQPTETNYAAREFKTPFYVFDTDAARAKITRLKALYKEPSQICYAVKANPFIVEALKDSADFFEACSFGEFLICEKACVPYEKMIMSGVMKNCEDIAYALKASCGRITLTAESETHWEYIKKACNALHIKANVLLRLSSGNQFGMDKSVLKKIIAQKDRSHAAATNENGINICGIHYFSGTQKKNPARIIKELKMLDELILELKDKYGVECERLEYGPGYPIAYFDGERDDESLVADTLKAAGELSCGIKPVIEVGRYLAAECGTYFTGVADIKNNGGENYIICDGGIHQMNYYGQMMAMKKPDVTHIGENKACEAKEYTVCGSLCSANDVLVKQLSFKDAKKGDVLAFGKTGAYSVTEGIALFLSRELPAVYVYDRESGFTKARDLTPVYKLNCK